MARDADDDDDDDGSGSGSWGAVGGTGRPGDERRSLSKEEGTLEGQERKGEGRVWET